MTDARAATGLTNRLRVRSLTLVAALIGGGVLAACGGARASAGSVSAQPLRYPRDAARFAAEPTSDSTLAFAAEDARWVKIGLLGIAVDPARGDALVAKLRVTAVHNGRVEALVTGQTTRVASSHVVLLVAPKTPWWRQRLYWIGTLSGAALVGTLALLL